MKTNSFQSQRPILRRTIETDLEGGDCFVRIEIPHPVAGHAPIVFETPVVPQARREWARAQAGRHAAELHKQARGLTADPCFISYLETPAKRAA